MKSYEVRSCMFEEWYPSFKPITFKSEILDLPAEFVSYLLADGLVLPERNNIQSSASNSDEDDDWNSTDTAEAIAPSFPMLDDNINASINRLGGAVMPKLNWSAPRDASWITLNHTLKCCEPNDVYLLLKSSDFITHDLTEPFKHCEDDDAESTDQITYKLVLREWNDINVGMEFRCFVKENKLIGVSQRHHTNYFDYIQHQEDKLVRQICNFYEKKMHKKFTLNSFAFDIYIDKNKTYLVDINPFGRTTDSLLFSWQELQSGMENQQEQWPEFRYNKESYIQGNVYQQFKVPKDFVDLASGSDPNKLYDLLHLKIQSQNEEISSDGEESLGG